MKKIFFAGFVFIPIFTFSQPKSPENPLKIVFSGYVKSDIFYDSRQNVSIREGHFYLYPAAVSYDQNHEDINAKSNFNMLAVQTRFAVSVSGPDVLGAKSSAYTEAEFFGHSDADINGFRLRHAFAKLAWENSELLVGQFWHALFITDCFPNVVSFNTGAPFQPFSRNPQVRYTQKAGRFKISFSALSQRDFTSTGPAGSSSAYLRNNVLPELNLTALYFSKNEKGNEFQMGFGADYLSLLPRLKTNLNYATNEKTKGFSLLSFFRYKTKTLTLKAEGVYGQNTTHLTMLGGYVVKRITNEGKDFVEYLPVQTCSAWMDAETNGSKIQAGFFAGYTKNLGAGETVAGPYYSRGSDIGHVFRVAPRLIFNAGKMRFAAEAENTTAAYGTTQSDGTVSGSKNVNNFRLLLGVYYFF